QVTYLNSFEVVRVAGGRTEELAGVAVNANSDEGYYRWRGNTSLDWTWHGFDLVATMRYTNGFREIDANDNFHYVAQRFLFDLQASYDFSVLAHHEEAAASSYAKDSKGSAGASNVGSSGMSIFDRLLNGTRFTIGCTNVFDQDPPFASGQGGNAVGYPGFTYDSTGQFVYVRLTKKF
ncbi:MAG: TonB-dependent receptor, partial [Verrucomicrobiota bacterium]|nr:TonB-dependent receptor [Verrucomicrobiota bacterium]